MTLAEIDDLIAETTAELQADKEAAAPEVAEAIEGEDTRSTATDIGLGALEGARRAVQETREAVEGIIPSFPSALRLSEQGELVDSDGAPAVRFLRNPPELPSFGSPQTAAGGIAQGVSQFLTGFIGIGKVTAPIKAVKALRTGGKVAKTGENVARAAATSAVAFDPDEARLSNFLVQFPMFDNAVTRYLAADPNDTEAEGRLKLLLESLAMDAALIGPFVAGLRGIKAARNVRRRGVSREIDAQLERAVGGLDEPPAPAPRAKVHGKSQGEVEADLDEAAKPRVRVAAGDDTGQTARLIPEEDTARPPETIGDAMDRIGARRAAPVEPEAAGPRARPFPEEEVAPVVRGVVEDAVAILTHGSRLRAAEAGVETGADPLPWQKLLVPENLEAFIERVAKAAEKTIAFRRGGDRAGVLRDKTARRLAEIRAQLWGDDPDTTFRHILNQGRAAKSMVADRIAAEALSVKAMQEAYEVAAKLNMGDLARWNGSAAEALTEFTGRVAVATELLAANRAIGTAFGRGLRTMRKDASTRLTMGEVLKMRGLSPEKLAKLLASTGGDIHALKFALSRPSMLGRAVGEANWLLINNLLWGLTTHVVNITTTAYMMAARPLQRASGSYGLQLTGKLGSADATAMRTQALREFRYMTASLFDSANMAFRALRDGESILAGSGSSEAFKFGSRRAEFKALRLEPIKDVADLARAGLKMYYWSIGAPTRLLGTVDELTRQVRYRGMVMADASMEADKRGLKGDAFRRFVHRSLLDSFDENGRGLNDRALREAKLVTFQDELQPGTLGSTLQLAVGRHPTLRQAFPFVRTPINVLREGIRLTPGLNLLQKRYRQSIQGLHGDEAQATAIGQMAFGTLFATMGAWLALNGQLTGSGPNNRAARRNVMSLGWKPNSIVTLGRDDRPFYWHVGRFDPIGLAFGMAADIVHISEVAANDPEGLTQERLTEALAGYVLALAEQVRERSYVQTIVQVIAALGDPARSAPQVASRMLSNLVPFSSAFRNYGGLEMQYMREARTFLDNIMATIPGLAEGVPLRYNSLGEPILIRRGPWSETKDDVVDEEIIRMGIESPEGFTLGRMSPNTGKGVDLRDIEVEPEVVERLGLPSTNAYEAVQVLAAQPDKDAPTLREALERTILSPTYQAAADGLATTRGTKQWLLSRITSQYRRAASGMLRAASPKLREALFEAEAKARAALEGVRAEGDDGSLKAQRDMLRRLEKTFLGNQ